MKFVCFIGMSYLLCFQLKAQNVDFIFKETLNNLIVKKEGQSPYAFEIAKQEYSSTTNIPSTKRISQFYKRTLAFSNKAKSDSTKIAKLKKESKLTPEIAKELNEEEVNNRLRIARRSLKTAKKYEIVPSEVIINTHYKLKIRKNIFKPEHVIIGEFKDLGLFYVTKSIKGYNESDLIAVAEAEKNKLTSDSFLFKNTFTVIQNIDTEVMYMIFPEFLDKYAINKIALQSKYQEKINLTQTEYTNPNDKKIDALILEYNNTISKMAN